MSKGEKFMLVAFPVAFVLAGALTVVATVAVLSSEPPSKGYSVGVVEK